MYTCCLLCLQLHTIFLGVLVCKTHLRATAVFPEAASTKQKDLHKELSALRVDLESITIAAPGSNISQVRWKVWARNSLCLKQYESFKFKVSAVGFPCSQLQSLPTQPHYLDGFEVLYRALLPASSDWAAKKVMMPSFQCHLGPLKRGFKYEFKVRPYGSNLYGRESNTQHLRVPETGEKCLSGFCMDEAKIQVKNNTRLTLHTVPSASPQTVSISVSHQQNNTIHLSWEPPPLDTHNGILQGYQVIDISLMWC